MFALGQTRAMLRFCWKNVQKQTKISVDEHVLCCNAAKSAWFTPWPIPRVSHPGQCLPMRVYGAIRQSPATGKWNEKTE
jgi:hypothetical protein